MPLPASRVFDQLVELAACLCNQIKSDGLPEPCFCGVLPGEDVAASYAGSCSSKCGMAWVRLSTAYPATEVGTPNATLGNCGSGLGYEIEIGTLRCLPVGNAAGAPPTAEQMLASTQLQVADMHAMQKAVLCCFDSRDVILGAYEPLGPEGGLAGGTFIVQVAI